MRTRTLVIAGTGAAAVAYLLDPQGGKARRDRIRASIRPVTRGRTVRVEPISAPILEQPREDPIPPSAPAPLREEPISVAGPSAALDDATIVRSVRTKLQERRDLRTDDLVVDVVNGVAYLSGGLRDRWTFGEIIDLTGEVPGVRRVQSLLHLPHSETISMTISDRRTDEDRGA